MPNVKPQWEIEFDEEFSQGNLKMSQFDEELDPKKVKDFIAKQIKEAYDRGEKENRYHIIANFRGWGRDKY